MLTPQMVQGSAPIIDYGYIQQMRARLESSTLNLSLTNVNSNDTSKTHKTLKNDSISKKKRHFSNIDFRKIEAN